MDKFQESQFAARQGNLGWQYHPQIKDEFITNFGGGTAFLNADPVNHTVTFTANELKYDE